MTKSNLYDYEYMMYYYSIISFLVTKEFISRNQHHLSCVRLDSL